MRITGASNRLQDEDYCFLGENIDFIEDIRDGDMKARGMTG
jgi:hypothetical protein